MNRRKIITESLKSPNKLRRCLLAHGTHQYQMDKKLSVQRVILQEPPSWAKRLVVQPVKDHCMPTSNRRKKVVKIAQPPRRAYSPVSSSSVARYIKGQRAVSLSM